MSGSTYTIAAAVAAAIALGACKDRDTPTLAARPSALPDSSDQMMFGLKHYMLGQGIRRAELHADTAYFYDQGNRVDLRQVNTTFFSGTGAKDAAMTAKSGLLDQRTQKLDARGDVVVTSEDGRRLTSPHLTYDRQVNQITSDTTFTFTSPGRTMSGIGFRSDPQLRNVQVLSGARGNTVLPAGGLTPRRPKP